MLFLFLEVSGPKPSNQGENDFQLFSVSTITVLKLTLQYIVIETIYRKNCVQGPLLLKLLFVGLKTMSSSVTAKHPAHCNIHCVPFELSIMCSYHFSMR